MAEFNAPRGPAGMILQAPDFNWSAAAVLATSTSASTQSAIINSRVVLLSADTGVWLTVGYNPTASVGAGSFYLPANIMWMLAILPGQQIAVIDAPGGPAGHLAILPGTYPG